MKTIKKNGNKRAVLRCITKQERERERKRERERTKPNKTLPSRTCHNNDNDKQK